MLLRPSSFSKTVSTPSNMPRSKQSGQSQRFISSNYIYGEAGIKRAGLQNANGHSPARQNPNAQQAISATRSSDGNCPGDRIPKPSAVSSLIFRPFGMVVDVAMRRLRDFALVRQKISTTFLPRSGAAGRDRNLLAFYFLINHSEKTLAVLVMIFFGLKFAR
jgi:hypothetical protein